MRLPMGLNFVELCCRQILIKMVAFQWQRWLKTLTFFIVLFSMTTKMTQSIMMNSVSSILGSFTCIFLRFAHLILKFDALSFMLTWFCQYHIYRYCGRFEKHQILLLKSLNEFWPSQWVPDSEICLLVLCLVKHKCTLTSSLASTMFVF